MKVNRADKSYSLVKAWAVIKTIKQEPLDEDRAIDTEVYRTPALSVVGTEFAYAVTVRSS